MATPKATFSLDDATLRRLSSSAERTGRSKSEIVREAVAEYAARVDRLSEGERLRLLRAFDDLVPRIPSQPAAEADRELAEVRRARRQGGRRSQAGRGK